MTSGRRGGRKTGKPDAPKVTNFGDHAVIVPKNLLRKAWARNSAEGLPDPVADAERALAALSGEFAGWMDSECERLDTARKAVRAKGFDAETRQALYHAAHDIKGEAATFGFPRAATAAASLCRLIERTTDTRRIPLTLVDQHVDAVRAIVREHGTTRAEIVADALTARLREIVDAFLKSENGGRLPDDDEVLSPPTVPRADGP
ncbi:Hpt domain-containing protein [Rhodoplanes sp. TEM]|uniref:Hpt domain-containing protein n=1 Tax=Rhodoplanes tepidamans TaxID=200616 RepID=A0ABT5JF30_RHOTP|nr:MULTISPECIES: Hpt domain-containing protein [Rhodoplanes]MDC7788167.1 Hpt domain-containing protein [Rhodoplanes tepidamans]MDC7986524.1 Hpt domain-containing protein [Rhodoplanes sp. TEM]MDQ0355143.1 HPt (histidine-containing phosphotransfer) domain-containing protein [Rhodoplanes tepidamans]